MLSATALDGKLATLVDELDRQLACVNSRSRHVVDEDGIAEVRAWRLQVWTSVTEIIAPEEIMWMNDDEGLTDEQYGERALEDIQRMSER